MVIIAIEPIDKIHNIVKFLNLLQIITAAAGFNSTTFP